MGDTSAELEKKSGSDLDPNASVLSDNTIGPESQETGHQNSSSEEAPTDNTNTNNPKKIMPDDPDQLDTRLPKLQTAANNSSPSSLNNRYDIYPGNPLPEFNSPSARAFKVEDRMQPQLKLFGLICIPGLPIRLSEIEKISGKVLPGNLNLISFGNINWPILKQKCLVLIFKSPLGQRIDKFFQSKQTQNIKKIDAINLIAKTGITSLFSLRERQLTNRSIRPDNIFFADADREEIVFGEFVTSPPGFDQPIVYETIERSMAGEGGRGQGTLDDDIYALGATLAFLLQNQFPFRGKSNEQIIFSKITLNSYQALVGKKLLTRDLSGVIRGMLQDDVIERWDFKELDTWLRNQPVKLSKNVVPKKSRRAFRFGEVDHRNLKTLAYSMSTRRESALEVIKDGSIENWIAKNFKDEELINPIAVAKENFADFAETTPHADELLLSRVLMLIDPKAPITYKDISYMPDGFGSAMATEMLRGGNAEIYTESIINGIPDIWYTTSDGTNPHQYTEIEFYSKMSGYLQKAGPGFGIERCLYESNTGFACQSPIIVKENIFSIDFLLQSLNAAEKTVDTKNSPIDRHIAAFIAARSKADMDEPLSKLGDLDDTIKTLSMLKLLVDLQKTMNTGTLLGLAKWVGGLMGPVIKLYHSREKRKEVEAAVPKIVRSGSLSELLSLLDNPLEKEKDKGNYLTAVDEFGETADEIEKIKGNTGPESESGDRTSKQAAAIISGLIMILLIIIMIVT
nr:hypothetical protein [Rhodospirillales bacterium]